MLESKRIRLRPLKVQDKLKMHEWRNSLDLIKLTQGIRFPKTIEMETSWFESILNDISNKNVYFAIETISQDEFIGIVQLNNINQISGTSTLGFMIGDSKNQGQGYGKEFVELIVSYAFNILNLRKITSYVVDYNSKSLNLFQKLDGFKQEGKLVEHFYFEDSYNDVLIYSLHRNKIN